MLLVSRRRGRRASPEDKRLRKPEQYTMQAGARDYSKSSIKLICMQSSWLPLCIPKSSNFYRLSNFQQCTANTAAGAGVTSAASTVAAAAVTHSASCRAFSALDANHVHWYDHYSDPCNKVEAQRIHAAYSWRELWGDVFNWLVYTLSQYIVPSKVVRCWSLPIICIIYLRSTLPTLYIQSMSMSYCFNVAFCCSLRSEGPCVFCTVFAIPSYCRVESWLNLYVC
jgi:hypothetical protein